jgi:hypothetical protein
MPLALLLDQLDHARRSFSAAEGPIIEALLNQLSAHTASDAAELIRLHELLLFIRAYPVSTAVASLADAALHQISARVALLADADVDALEFSNVSGISGSAITAVFTADLARDLIRRHPGQLSIHWEAWPNPERLIYVLRELFPLSWDDLSVEAGVPYREWLEAIGGLQVLLRATSAQYDALELPLRWNFGPAASRTLMRLHESTPYLHQQPLITRRDISLNSLPYEPPLPCRKVSRKRAEAIIALARDTSAVRYRELHGFTYGDPAHLYEIDPGRGVLLYVWGVPPNDRLPLRTYLCATIWKNGIPIGYFEGLSLAERMEAGFNLYYTFREGETAWLYGRLLRLCHQLTDVTCFTLDPYQIGHENKEAIESGAFWFYRKLGFHSTSAGIRNLTAREEKKIAANPAYRTSAATLRKLVREPMIYGFPGAKVEDWYGFQSRRVGLNVARGGGWTTKQKKLLAPFLAAKQAPQESPAMPPALRTEILRLGKA